MDFRTCVFYFDRNKSNCMVCGTVWSGVKIVGLCGICIFENKTSCVNGYVCGVLTGVKYFVYSFW